VQFSNGLAINIISVQMLQFEKKKKGSKKKKKKKRTNVTLRKLKKNQKKKLNQNSQNRRKKNHIWCILWMTRAYPLNVIWLMKQLWS